MLMATPSVLVVIRRDMISEALTQRTASRILYPFRQPPRWLRSTPTSTSPRTVRVSPYSSGFEGELLDVMTALIPADGEIEPEGLCFVLELSLTIEAQLRRLTPDLGLSASRCILIKLKGTVTPLLTQRGGKTECA